MLPARIGRVEGLLNMRRSVSKGIVIRKCLLAAPGGVEIRTYWPPLGGVNKNLLAGSLFQSLGVPISSGDSALPLGKERHYT